jgi:hypothetical protein
MDERLTQWGANESTLAPRRCVRRPSSAHSTLIFGFCRVLSRQMLTWWESSFVDPFMAFSELLEREFSTIFCRFLAIFLVIAGSWIRVISNIQNSHLGESCHRKLKSRIPKFLDSPCCLGRLQACGYLTFPIYRGSQDLQTILIL